MAGEKKISEILLSIDNGEYTIPEFQRGYVWNSKQVKGFFRSLYLGYPSGSFLIWKTKEPSKIRGEQKDSNSIFHQLILDGQQRLTTIYTIFKGETPEWYEGVSLRTDLYFDLENEEFEYFMPKKMANNPEWINVSDFLRKGGVSTFITYIQSLDDDAKNYYLSKIVILNKLGAIQDYGYYIKEITLTNIEKVVEIFNLVNKTGTTLNESDLALAIITSNWPNVKDKYREAIEKYKLHNYNFSFNFFTRCINILTTERGKFTSDIANVTEGEFEAAWEKLNKILPHVINVLRDNAYIDSSDNYNSLYVLYVLVYYLSKNNLNFESEDEANKAIYWLFTALLWGRFSGSSESFLEKDMNVIKESNSIDGLINEMHLYRGSNLSLRPDDLALQGIRSKIYNLFYCAVRAQNAKDWTNPAVSLYSKNIGYNNKLQKHHIFPKAFLYKKLNSSNSIHKALVNEISNMSFITQQSNIEILASDPAKYLPKIDQIQLRKQFVPTNEKLYTIDNYELFLEERRKLLCKGLNKFLEQYYVSKDKNEIPEDLTTYNNEIEIVEFALRDLISQKLEDAAEEDSYSEFIPRHILDKANGRILSWLKKNPGEDNAQFTKIRRKLDFFDLQEYKDVITSKITWNLFEDNFGTKGVLMNRFSQLGELRNGIRHSRDITEATLKDGEAAISWFNSVLRNIIKEKQPQD
ncbi:GmrSD restriction endonuclease domain-containing protein [Polaribacter staleyi]|uniref:GmrSD restriction endonuclease domain-containing protein n=1 Tax=Polaribacter staleyi TaxID=2022337 RepID=UPI0031BA3992